jgi:hypothetical protein
LDSGSVRKKADSFFWNRLLSGRIVEAAQAQVGGEVVGNRTLCSSVTFVMVEAVPLIFFN